MAELTVRDLTNLLLALGEDEQNTPVVIDGCDCFDVASEVRVYDDEEWVDFQTKRKRHSIVITRHDGGLLTDHFRQEDEAR
jgi:hypothetical protein